MSQFTGAPIFDADQHMYETPDALTRYLPEEYESSIQFAQIGRNTRIVINGVVTDYIPNPTFNRVARPGAHEPYYAGNNPDGLTLQELMGRGIDCPGRDWLYADCDRPHASDSRQPSLCRWAFWFRCLRHFRPDGDPRRFD